MDPLASTARGATHDLASSLTSTVNGHHSSSSDPQETLQIIDDEQHFTTDLTARVRSWGVADKGFSYDVVAVFGSQSTGKSTLLNGLFGVKFDVMDEADRKQTTKGIWMAKGEKMDVLIMDVEGTDGRERGEDQDFERKAALFSMAAAEVIIVNMWEHQVGLYQGANMGLLKTVFEVNLALFQAAKGKKKAGSSDEKTHLLFVIRDHIGATPLANLKNTLVADLNRIWAGLSKPEGTEDSRITDYFDMTFTTLPHKLLQPENFEKEVVSLRRRFVDPSDSDYVFKPAYHKRIPADGLAPYMEGIWEAVVTNKDLDLPTQQELLAQFRCDEIAGAAFVTFEAIVAELRRPVNAGKVVDDLGPKMRTARDEALSAFDAAASRYHQGVYQRKRDELIAKTNSSLSPLFITQLKNLAKTLVRGFQAKLLAELKGEGYDFAAVVEKTRSEAEQTFVEGAKALVLPETEWSYEDALAQLQEDLTAIADRLRVEETKKMVLTIERTFKKQMAEPVELALNKPSPKMWDQVLKSFSEALKKAEESYLRKAKSFNSTDEEDETALTSIRKRAWLALRSKIDEQTTESVMLVKLKLAFEERFRYDLEGVPRVWRPEDDIDGAFRAAKDETLALIPLYARIEPSDPSVAVRLPSDPTPSDPNEPDFDFDSSLLVISETHQTLLASRFRREADAYYLEAKRSQVSSISQIPYWMYGVVAVLGWNEFVAVLRSPVYFMTVLVLLVSTYIVFQLNLQGPVLAIGRGVYNETVRVANDRLTDYFNDPTRLVPVPVSSTAGHAPPPARPSAVDELELEERKKTE